MASEWVEVAPGVIQRSLRGIEITLNQIEYHHQGNVSVLCRSASNRPIDIMTVYVAVRAEYAGALRRGPSE